MNFDRVADIYDATRSLPPQVSEQIADGIFASVGAGPDTCFLEPGIGTGRMALPLARLGLTYTGIDISDGMMEQLRAKASSESLNIRLEHGDVTDLPFPDASFDVVLIAHLLHLVPEWRKALADIWRVTVPGGHVVMAGNHHVPDDPGDAIRRQWHEYAREMDAPLRPSYGTWNAVNAELTTQGCYTAVYRVAEWDTEFVPAELIEKQRSRMFSHSWDLPDETLQAVHDKLLGWAHERYGDLERSLVEHQEFWISVSRWPA